MRRFCILFTHYDGVESYDATKLNMLFSFLSVAKADLGSMSKILENGYISSLVFENLLRPMAQKRHECLSNNTRVKRSVILVSRQSDNEIES